MSDLQSSESPKTGALPSDTTLGGRYLVQQRLGQGGMGAVYRAHDQRLDITCAIKEMSAALLKTDEERDRARRAFHEEAKLLARLAHPNLPRVTDHFTENGKEYLVMEYVPGETLAQVMRRNPPPWSVEAVMALAEPLAEVLHYLHTRTPPIIFRDLKPANVMRTPEGQIKLIDFGIARLFKPGQSHDTQAFGTMGYSAPEQYGQGQTDARSDVYALGVLLHQLISAHDPISQPFNVPLAHRLNPNIPEQFSAVLQTAMSHEPENRFGSMVAFRRALGNAAALQGTNPFIAAPTQQAMQPQVGYMPQAQPYNRPTPQQPYNQPYGPPTPQQPYGPPAPQQYNQQTYGQPTPNRPLGQPTGPQTYGPPTPQQPYAPAQPVSYGMPPVMAPSALYGAPLPQAKTSGLANVSRWFGIIGIGLAGISFALGEAGVATAFFGILLAVVNFILALVALNQQETKATLKGRSHAGLGLGLSIATLVVACMFIVTIAQHYN
jgi:serine/threonine protein kinase